MSCQDDHDKRQLLLDSFANTDIRRHQRPEIIHASEWALEKFPALHKKMGPTEARKKQECSKGFVIEAGETYYRYVVLGAGNPWKFCISCTALILFFLT